MAKLVGVPCGIAVQLVLDGVINQKGVLAPCEFPPWTRIRRLFACQLMRVVFSVARTDTREIVDPLIKGVEKEGITMVEKVL